MNYVTNNPSPRSAGTCHSSLKLSDLVGYLNTTDREPVRTIDAAHADSSAVEVEAEGEVAVR